MKRHIKRVVLPFVTLTMLAVAPISSNHGSLLAPEAKVFREGESVLTKTVTYDFTKIDGFEKWTSSYIEHVVPYEDGTVIFSSADKQANTITNMPVTKGQKVTYTLNVPEAYITSYTFTCKKWGSNAQTITEAVSKNGTDFTKTSNTSSNFTLANNNVSGGTDLITALQFTFSSTKNQVGIQSLEVTYFDPSFDPTQKKVTFVDTDLEPDIAYTTKPYQLTAIPSKNGYNFVAWYLDEQFENLAPETINITEDIYLYPKWEKIDATSISSLVDGEYNRVFGKVIAKTNATEAYLANGESILKLVNVPDVSIGDYIDVCGLYTSGNLNTFVYFDILENHSSVLEPTIYTSVDDINASNVNKYFEVKKIKLGAQLNSATTITANDRAFKVQAKTKDVLGGISFANGDYVNINGILTQSGTDLVLVISEIEKVNKYTVSFHTNYGTDTVTNKTVLDGDCATMENPTRPEEVACSYEFAGWNTEADGTGDMVDLTSTPITGSLTLYAIWTPIAKSIQDVFIASTETKSNVRFDYDVSPATERGTYEPTNIHIEDLWDGKSGGRVIDFSSVEDHVSIVADQSDGSNAPLFYASSSPYALRFYQYNTLTISSKNGADIIDSIVFVSGGNNCTFSTSKYTIPSNEANDVTLSEDGTTLTVKPLSGTEFSFTPSTSTNKVYMTDIIINYKETDVEVNHYSNFRNAQLQFKYDYEFYNLGECDETGLLITDDSEFLFASEEYSSNFLPDEMLNEGKHIYYSKNTNRQRTWKVGINLTEDQIDLELTAAPYIVIDGVYYFGTAETMSAYDVLDHYSKDESYDAESKRIINGYLDQIISNL